MGKLVDETFMQISIVFTGQLTKTYIIFHVRKETYACFYEEFYSLQITKVRRTHTDETI